MPNNIPNSTNYEHSNEPNLVNLHKAMDYTFEGKPYIRTGVGNAYAQDAWGRPKAVHDYSIFSATWTFNVPSRVWEEVSWDYVNEVPQLQPTFSKVSSRLNMLSVLSGTSTGNGTVARSRKFMRYQPNRGQLFSTAIIVPDATANASREWGLSTAQNGVMFELLGNGTDWDLQATRRDNGSVVERISIKAALLAQIPDFDPSKGNVYDIQYEWRGMGNFFFYVNLKLIYVMDVLGTLTGLTVSDPALPVSFVSTTLDGTERELLVGCVDVTSEGGQTPSTLFSTVDTNSSLLTLANSNIDTAVLALRVPRLINYNGNSIFNSRGAFMDKLVTWTRDESHTKVFAFRQITATNIDAITWSPVPDSRLEYARGGNGSALQTAFLTDNPSGQIVLSEWADQDYRLEITNPSSNSPFQVVPGDILVISVAAITTNVKSSATLYFSEEL